MKEFFGNEHSTDKYEMMEKFFKNDDGMDAFKMMMKFSGDEKNMDMSEMMHSMEKMYGNNFKTTQHDYNKFNNKDHKNFNYAPPQSRYRFKRQASGSTKPVDYTKPTQGLDKGDRLFAKLQEQKKDMEAHVGNMTCVLRETNVLNKENEIDVKSLRRAWSNTPCQAHGSRTDLKSLWMSAMKPLSTYLLLLLMSTTLRETLAVSILLM